jgi:high-affinity nickel-transport protein
MSTETDKLLGVSGPTVELTSSSPPPLGRKLKLRAASYVFLLVVVNVFLLAFLGFLTKKYPQFSGPGMLAYTFGLRHAVDADHIAAIDNVTRKLLMDSKKTSKEPPLLVGFFFSLGHSTVVFLLCAATALGSR